MEFSDSDMHRLSIYGLFNHGNYALNQDKGAIQSDKFLKNNALFSRDNTQHCDR